MDKSSDGFRFTQALLPLLIGVMGTWVWQNLPDGANRPDSSSSAPHMARHVEKVDARLWEDPFDAVVQHEQAEAKNGSSGQHHQASALAAEIREILADSTKPGSQAAPLTVLAVMVSGGPYFEDAEQRRRIRYAVLSGISAWSERYTVLDPEHIRYVRFDTCNDTNPQPTDALAPCLPLEMPRFLPYEWVSLKSAAITGPGAIEQVSSDRAPAPANSSESRTGKALVLWVNSDYLDQTPAATLSQLLHEITRLESGDAPGISPERLQVKVIGPSSSNGLQALWDEVRKRSASAAGKAELANCPKIEFPLEFFSPRATVHECVVFNACGPEGQKLSLSERFAALTEGPGETQPIRFIRTTASDNKLAEAMRDELKLRGVVPGPNQHVVLISEWDTLYGWNLPRTFRAAMEPPECGVGESAGLTRNGTQLPPCVHRFSYLRGMDGEGPRAKSKEDGKDIHTGSPQRAYLADSQDRPEGQSQYDYLRRLATKLAHLEASIKQDNPAASIRAVGVLASDVYDKLLILRALRARFPEALFFTTDLDERLLHPSQNDWTRNLLIVSGFGFELNPQLQQDIPPFRDGYQTAYFLSTQMALTPGDQWRQKAVERWLKPRVYEIGRTETLDLTAQPRSLSRYRCNELASCESVQPTASTRLYYPGFGNLVLIVVGLAFAMAFLWLAFSGLRRVLRRHRYPLAGAALLSMLAVLCGWLTWSWSYETLEPWRWLEGVSVWPSELIRVLAIVLILLCIRQSLCVQKGNWLSTQLQAVETDFFAGAASPQDKPFCQRFTIPQRGQLRSVLGRHWMQENIGQPPEAGALWHEFKRQIGHRPFRSFIYALLFGLSGLFIVLATGLPHLPSRGSAALLVDRLLMFLAISGFCYLLLLVFDMARVTEKMVDYFADPQHPVQWPRSSGSDALAGQASLRLKEIQFIGRLTAAISRMVWYPFFAMMLLLAARSRFFDHWYTPTSLWVLYAISLSMIFARARGLNRASQQAKQVAMARVRDEIFILAGDKDAGERERQAGMILERIAECQDGAFAPLSSRPVFRALLTLIGTQGAIQLMEQFVMNAVG